MNDRGMRVARGLVAAGIATFVAAFSHVAAGGGAPGSAGLALAVAFSAVTCVLLTRRALSLPLLAISVLMSQFAFHLLFEVGSASGMATTASGIGGVAAGHTAHHGISGAMIASTAGSTASTHPHDGGWMWVAHAIAALATIALLHRGERMLRRLLALARTPLAAGVRAARLPIVVAAALLDPGAPRAVLTRQRDVVRLVLERARLGVVDRLAECGVVFTRLRHRGPPVRGAARFSV